MASLIKMKPKKYKSHPIVNSLTLLVSDLVSIGISFGLAIFFRSISVSIFHSKLEQFSGYYGLILFNVLILILIFALGGLYRGFGTVAVHELRHITLSIIISFVIFAFAVFVIGKGNRLSRTVILLSMLFCLIFIPILRLIIYNRFSRSKNWGVSTAIIGSTAEFSDIAYRLERLHRLGFNPEVILCTDSTSTTEKNLKNIPIYEFSEQKCHNLKDEGILYAFYSTASVLPNDKVLIEISKIFSTIYYILPESGLSSLWIDTTDLLGRPGLKVRYQLLDRQAVWVKRCLEVLLTFIGLLITLPFSIIILLLIKIEHQGPVLYKQQRYSISGKVFDLLKFRTMKPNADQILHEYLEQNPNAKQEYLTFHKLKKDPRVTRIGRFLRKFSLDEIPQLINILRGDMNLIGPRAYMVDELDLKDELTQTILRVKPGMTGWWQVSGRNSTTFKGRQELDFYYIKNWSLWLDLYILIKTFWTLMSGQGK